MYSRQLDGRCTHALVALSRKGLDSRSHLVFKSSYQDAKNGTQKQAHWEDLQACLNKILQNVAVKAAACLFSGAEAADMAQSPLHVVAVSLLLMAQVTGEPPPTAGKPQPPAPSILHPFMDSRLARYNQGKSTQPRHITTARDGIHCNSLVPQQAHVTRLPFYLLGAEACTDVSFRVLPTLQEEGLACESEGSVGRCRTAGVAALQ